MMRAAVLTWGDEVCGIGWGLDCGRRRRTHLRRDGTASGKGIVASTSVWRGCEPGFPGIDCDQADRVGFVFAPSPRRVKPVIAMRLFCLGSLLLVEAFGQSARGRDGEVRSPGLCSDSRRLAQA